MEGGVAILLLVLLIVGGGVALLVFGGGGGLLGSRKGRDAGEGARQGRAARDTREHIDDRARRAAERRGDQADRPTR
mgnify:CR=1 FL=1